MAGRCRQRWEVHFEGSDGDVVMWYGRLYIKDGCVGVVWRQIAG
jgi:hypothetical protein